jgi:CRP/FNR family transcriptional regulator
MFSKVPSEGFARLVTMARLVKYRKGQRVFREGDECPGVFVVGAGLVRVFKTAPGGKEHVLHMVGPGGTFAEVAAIGGFAVPANAQAIAASACALLPADRFRKILDEDHRLCLGLLSGLTFWVRRLVELMGDVVLRDAAGRLARFLLNAPSKDGDVVELPALKRHLASHLNLTSETFSRTLRRLVDAGLITQEQGNAVRLLDRETLGRVAEGMFPKI